MVDDERISVAFASDEINAIALATAIASILMRRAPTTFLDLHVLSCGISTRSRKRIESVVERLGQGRALLTWHPIEGQHANWLYKFYLDSDQHYPPAAYARLLMGRMLPESVSRIIYMDSDIIVRTDLAPLWNTSFGSDMALVVRDPNPHYVDSHPGRLIRTLSRQDVDRYGVTREMHYFQSGVMCLDLARFRNGVDDEVLEIIKRYPMLSFPDQDALNIVLARSRRFIDPRWNHAAHISWYNDAAASPYDFATFTALREDPYVVHYTGKPKPWENGCTHPFFGEWVAAHQQTAWAARRRTWLRLAVDRVPRARRMIIKKVRRALNI